MSQAADCDKGAASQFSERQNFFQAEYPMRGGREQ